MEECDSVASESLEHLELDEAEELALLARRILPSSLLSPTESPDTKPRSASSGDSVVEAVARQYESFPYPHREPEDDRESLALVSPGNILEINHYIWNGTRDFKAPFRVLVVGGGTGDTTVCLAQQLQDLGCPYEVWHLDLSAASIEICKRRVHIRQLRNVHFLHASLLEVDMLNIGVFDYVDASGVLHHLPNPSLGLRTLSSCLAPTGGMGVMLYAPYGRTGVYELQELIRSLNRPSGSDNQLPDQIKLVRELLHALPDSNRFKRNRFMMGSKDLDSDAGVVDLLIHACDRAFTVKEIHNLVQEAALEIITFLPRISYEPTTYLDPSNQELLTRIEQLPDVDRWHAAEVLAGDMYKHTFYLRKMSRVQSQIDDTTFTSPTSNDILSDQRLWSQYVPILMYVSAEELAERMFRGGRFCYSGYSRDTCQLCLRYLLPVINGHRTIDQIFEHTGTRWISTESNDEVPCREVYGSHLTHLMNLLIDCDAAVLSHVESVTNRCLPEHSYR
eukprot:GILJ01008790.1.p1 GENE.GILJ01008790.1~~GILJ01008790.1.p1  ORF type:complete len:506 (-),score=59.53 GILJ01008790.1:42-1559(-)